MWPKGVFLEWFLSYRHFLVETWNGSGKPAGLSRGNSFQFTKQDASSGGRKVRWGPSISWTQSCHSVTSPHPITILQIPLGICPAHFYISFCWTSSAKPLQSVWAGPRRVRPVFLCCSPTCRGAERGWQLDMSTAVLLEESCWESLSLCSKTLSIFHIALL